VCCPIQISDDLSGFPSKLHHDVPHWVEPNSLFHIRIRLNREKQQTPLTDALLAFQRDASMSRVIGDWKHFHARKNRIEWQEGFFNHRLRDDERGEQLQAKVNYIRQNPVVAGLCASAEEWPWVIDRSS